MKYIKEIKYYGKREELPQNRMRKAGRISALYENGSLRYVKYNNTEVIRMIYAAVRDKDWLTAHPEISNEIIDVTAESFHINYDCRYRLNDIDFRAQFQIVGNASGSISFEMQGEALTTFMKNRIGFCVLHPVEGCAGRDCRITHTDGSMEVSSFPEYINPRNPFRDVQAMEWQTPEGIRAVLDFSGDVFETEDHRNWTDASFKTYCTPLDKPYPVKIDKGTVIAQKVELKVFGVPNIIRSRSDATEIKSDMDYTKPLPAIGIGRSTRDRMLSEEDARVLREMHFSHYRTDLYLFDAGWKESFLSAARESKLLNCPLELALFFGEDAQAEAKLFLDLYKEVTPSVKSVFLFHKTIQSTPDELISTVAGLCRKHIPGAMLFAGTNGNFAQLNRARPDTSHVDGLVFAVHPQEHAFDLLTLAENLQGQSYAVESARQFAHGKRIAVSPVTIQRRFNANIENFEAPSSGKEMPWQVDPRQMSLFGAAWTAISFKNLALSGASSVTFYETVGERGLMTGQSGSRWPQQFFAAPETFFPLFHVFAFLSKFPEAEIIASCSANPLLADALVLKDKDGLSMIVSNINHQTEYVWLPEANQSSKVLLLDEDSYDEAVRNAGWLNDSEWTGKRSAHKGLKIELRPYATAFIRYDY
jgi:D-apionolactonase